MVMICIWPLKSLFPILKKSLQILENFENELKIDLIGQTIKQIRKERNLTQEQLGELVGVKKGEENYLMLNYQPIIQKKSLRIKKQNLKPTNMKSKNLIII